MLKKSDVLPFILALISTMLVVGLGFLWLTKINVAKFGQKSNISNNNTSKLPARKKVAPEATALKSSQTNSTVFAVPAIVPQGTAITINGSTKMDRINQKLKRNFHKQFPGTGVIVDAEGTQTAIALLRSGDIDLAAIDRSLKAEEKAEGLAAVAVNSLTPEQNHSSPTMYYVYRKPANADVEVFLGYMLSPEGQAIIGRQ